MSHRLQEQPYLTTTSLLFELFERVDDPVVNQAVRRRRKVMYAALDTRKQATRMVAR